MDVAPRVDSNVSVTVRLLFTAGSHCLFWLTSGVDTFATRTPRQHQVGSTHGRRTAGLVEIHIRDIFSAAVRWQRIRRSESRLLFGMSGPERRLAVPVTSKRLRFVCCADTPSALPLRSIETCVESNCIEVLRRKPSEWLRAVRESRAILADGYRQSSRSPIVNRSVCLLHVKFMDHGACRLHNFCT